jgi:hypothetical protein
MWTKAAWQRQDHAVFKHAHSRPRRLGVNITPSAIVNASQKLRVRPRTANGRSAYGLAEPGFTSLTFARCQALLESRQARA